MDTSNVKESIDERILRLLGLEDVFDLDYDTYLTLLKEAMVKGRMPKTTIPTEEIEALTDEYKRVKGKKNKGRFEVKKGKKINSTLFGVGTMKKGNDNQIWVIMNDKNNNKRWVPKISVELNGLKALTVDYLAKNINKTIKLYNREYGDKWANKNDWLEKNKIKVKDLGYHTILFKPTGNALLGKKVLNNWLKTQQPTIKDNTNFNIEGYISFDNDQDIKNMSLSSLQVDSKNKKIVSSNLINIESFYSV